jgi:hypothetical protein
MVTRSRSFAIVLAALGAASACQAILGLDDKELGPAKTPDDSGTDAKPEADADADAEVGPSGNDPVPPGRPPGAPVPSGKGATRWFAARTLYLGTVDPVTGQSDSSAWKRIGHDIDGECTTAGISKSDTSVTCKKPAGAPSESLEDGDDCRDNASGRLLSTGIQLLSTNFEAQLQANMNTAETATYLLRLDDLDDTPDDPYVRGALYITVPRDPTMTGAPKWNSEDEFIVDLASVETGSLPDAGDAGEAGVADAGEAGAADASDADATSDGSADAGDAQPGSSPLIDHPLYVFDKGYLTNDVWVSGDFRNSPMKFPLFVLGRISVGDTLTVTLTAELSPAHDGIVASQLSAVMDTQTIEDVIGPLGTEITLCNATLGDLLLNNYILPARDLASNAPSFASSSQPCSAESVGFAFRWEPVKPPRYVAPGLALVPKCSNDGG